MYVFLIDFFFSRLKANTFFFTKDTLSGTTSVLENGVSVILDSINEQVFMVFRIMGIVN